MGETRDYYADLEISPTAEIADIKKQFRKLGEDNLPVIGAGALLTLPALQYHPDRNPGREQEVNAQFQIIQAANEVLSDPTKKARYDASYGGRTNRYPAASGRKGNPWSEAAQNFPPPPRRNPPGGKPTTSGGGAQRWSSRFSAGVPPTAKQYTNADPETKKNAAKAFDTMRKSQAKKPQPKPEPPPPPPRTQTGRERAEASFGTRKASQATRPPTSQHDPSYRKPAPQPYDIGSQTQTPVPDPLSQFRDNGAHSHARYNSQYATHGGEKIDPFEGMRRTPSMRNAEDDTTRPSRADNLNNGTAGAYAKPSSQQQTHRSGGVDSAQQDTESMYANPSTPYSNKTSPSHSSKNRPTMSSSYYGSLSSVYNPQSDNLASSESQALPQDSPHFDKQLQDLLARLIYANYPCPFYPPNYDHTPRRGYADKAHHDSFSFRVDDDTFTPSDNSRSPSRRRPAHQSSFDKTNVDAINTKFSKEFADKPWNFTAGSPTADKPGAQPSNTDSPNPKQSNLPDDGTATEAPVHETGFNPGGWTDKFGPQTFVPQQAPAGSASPTKASRTNSRKNKPAKSNANNPIVINDSDEEDLYEWTGRKPQAQETFTDGPQEMDIDTPPAVPPRPPPSARGIYVEPHRPEWRSDIVQPAAQHAAPEVSAGEPSTPPVGGSEDSEEFMASFEDLKNVAPFAQQKGGLKSFADLKDNLPFESRASGEVPLRMPPVQALVFPTPPTAPRPPPTVAIDNMRPSDRSWNKYFDDFVMYFQEWELFNTQVVDHFATRDAHTRRDRESKGYAFLGSCSENGIQEYSSCVQQDNDVRRQWRAACEGHEERFKEFMAFRNKMKEKDGRKDDRGNAHHHVV
ncbi:Heat shock protein DnaJ [Cordyceps fumosorosea ARSEF 2679]|uniref:Heat shock protein DnaJ n=1 Tax=Cordyceps fumosorosea (strain ARSEF 2679) TaxID=1081104 RepID=A0A167UDP6_CORFA|nr:Heat shock protein DnaJ [Cordyceps fumosorosea ARSEF 2679]OAA61484.1 Heat shock protein DnaJ [Cordyceps fumosorosea ARSEF 2679]